MDVAHPVTSTDTAIATIFSHLIGLHLFDCVDLKAWHNAVIALAGKEIT